MIETISTFEMANIYWSRKRAAAIGEIEFLMQKMSPQGKAYWTEVLRHLIERKNGRHLH